MPYFEFPRGHSFIEGQRNFHSADLVRIKDSCLRSNHQLVLFCFGQPFHVVLILLLNFQWNTIYTNVYISLVFFQIYLNNLVLFLKIIFSQSHFWNFEIFTCRSIDRENWNDTYVFPKLYKYWSEYQCNTWIIKWGYSKHRTLSSLYVSKHTAKNTIDFYLKIRTNNFPKRSFINYINKRWEGGSLTFLPKVV